MSDLGISFKSARESMNLTLEQVAAETKIGTRFLAAIETEEFHLLPGGIFSKGFVRSYAERLGIDPDKAVADFERQANYREPSVESLDVSTPKPGKSSRVLYPLAIGGLLALVIGFYVATRQPTSNSVSLNKPAAKAAMPEPAPAPAEPEASALPTPPVAAPVETPTPPTPNPAVATALPPATTPKEALDVVLQAKEQTWIKVLGDGKPVNAGEILEPGATRHYTAQTSINLILGNAGGVDIKINDRDMRPLGKSGQIREIKITPKNLKDLTTPG